MVVIFKTPKGRIYFAGMNMFTDRLHGYFLRISILLLFTILGCAETVSDSRMNSRDISDTFRFVETIVDSNHSDLISLGGFQRNDRFAIFQQRWELLDVDDASTNTLLFVDGSGDRIYQDIALFPDSQAVYNFRNERWIGKWKVQNQDKKSLLLLGFENGQQLTYLIQRANFRSLRLQWQQQGDSLHMVLRSDGKVHRNFLNDPLHPSNLRWMFPPRKKETDDEIRSRVKQCVRFFALFYRDVIKRESSTINFAGLPEIFTWYNGGIGLSEKDSISNSWIKCFYNKQQALLGYDMLRRLLVDHEFAWPSKTPNWFYKTHSVLEQMYHRL